MKPVCLVLGAGAGIGGTVAKKFALEGYHSCLCRRSDQDGLDRLVSNIEEEGGSLEQIVVGMISIGIAGYICSSTIRKIGYFFMPWRRLF